jgi:hypothetical protein
MLLRALDTHASRVMVERTQTSSTVGSTTSPVSGGGVTRADGVRRRVGEDLRTSAVQQLLVALREAGAVPGDRIEHAALVPAELIGDIAALGLRAVTVSLAIGAEASFVARTVDSDRKHLTEVLRQAAAHPGTALVEIYQNCNIFNDGAFDVLKDKQQAQEAVIRLEHGRQIRFGAPLEDGLGSKGVVRDAVTGDLTVVAVTPQNESLVLVHDAHSASPTTAFALSRLADPDTLHHTPIGVLRSVDRPVYDTQMAYQLDTAIEQNGKGDLSTLLTGGDAWTVL